MSPPRRAPYWAGPGLSPRQLLRQQNNRKRADRLRAARAKGTHTAEQWWRLIELCGGACARCRVGDVPLVKDHIVPIYQGGSDGIENIQPLCRRCNSSKGPDDTDHRPAGVVELVVSR